MNAIFSSSGREEMYSERDRLLQDIVEMCHGEEPTKKKMKKDSKEKKIMEKGKKIRSEAAAIYVGDAFCSSTLDAPGPSGSTSFVDHTYYNGR